MAKVLYPLTVEDVRYNSIGLAVGSRCCQRYLYIKVSNIGVLIFRCWSVQCASVLEEVASYTIEGSERVVIYKHEHEPMDMDGGGEPPFNIPSGPPPSDSEINAMNLQMADMNGDYRELSPVCEHYKGGSQKKKLKKSYEKHLFKGHMYTIYVGPRGGKYIRHKNKYVSIKTLP